jgi:hypothetical protein
MILRNQPRGLVVANWPFLLVSPAQIPMLFFEDFYTNAPDNLDGVNAGVIAARRCSSAFRP